MIVYVIFLNKKMHFSEKGDLGNVSSDQYEGNRKQDQENNENKRTVSKGCTTLSELVLCTERISLAGWK